MSGIAIFNGVSAIDLILDFIKLFSGVVVNATLVKLSSMSAWSQLIAIRLKQSQFLKIFMFHSLF